MNQVERLEAHFKAHGSIEPLEAWQKLGIYRLSEVVRKLRAEGNCIETETVKVKNCFGEDVEFGRYIWKGKVGRRFVQVFAENEPSIQQTGGTFNFARGL